MNRDYDRALLRITTTHECEAGLDKKLIQERRKRCFRYIK